MAQGYVNLLRKLSGQVGAVQTVIGVATDDYEVLHNKPSINGVELSGDLTLNQLGIVLTDGLTAEAKQLLIGILRNGVYTKDQSSNITALAEELNVTGTAPEEPEIPEVTMTGISVSYSGGAVDAGTAVNALRGIVVTASYSDGSSGAVTGYTLSGSIGVGNNVITARYGGFSATFTVIGNAVVQPPAVYTVTNNLTNVSTNNAATTATEGAAYSAVLTAANGYEMDTVAVSMGGTDITATAYQNGTVSISSVTGNLVVTAVASEVSQAAVNLFDKNTMVQMGYYCSSQGAIAPLSGNYAIAKVPITGGKSYAMQRKNLSFANGSAGNVILVDADGNIEQRFSFSASVKNEEGYYMHHAVTTNGTNSTEGECYLRTDDNLKGVTFTTTTECAYLCVTVLFGANDARDTFMVEEGTACSEYVAYA